MKCSILTSLLWLCFQQGSYELPLLWRETPVKVSCPVSHIQSQFDGPVSVCCSAHGMSVKLQKASPAELLSVNGKNHCYLVFQHIVLKVNVLLYLFYWYIFFYCSPRTVDSSGWAGWALWFYSGWTRWRTEHCSSIYYLWHRSDGKFQRKPCHGAWFPLQLFS